MRSLSVTAASALLLASGVASTEESNIKYINPLIGTDNVFSGNGNYAGMIPTTGTPFAMTRFTPMTMENNVGTCPYVYSDRKFYGFLATHQPAQWMGESGEIAISAGMGAVYTSFSDRGLEFSHDSEISRPHYYQAVLKSDVSKSNVDYQIIAELTSQSRAGLMKFTFDEKSATFEPYVSIQVTRGKIQGEVTVDPVHNEIFGWNPERQDDVLGPFTADDFKGYFVAKFDTNFVSWGTSNNSTLIEDSTFNYGQTVSAYVRFNPSVKVVTVRVGVSFLSVEQARLNLEKEVPLTLSLEDISNQVKEVWEEKVNRVQLDGATDDDKAIFYTGMYHGLQYPYEMMETNASGTFYYSGYDNQVHAGPHAYTGYSIWDTFRAEWAFLILFAPERIDGMIASMLQSYQEGGRLPIWLNIVETNIMIGTHSSSLIAEALAKGFKGFDLQVAWEAIWKDAMIPPKDDLTTVYYDREENTDCEARAGLTRELELGYVAAVHTSEAGSRTLEYAYDDYTVAVAAELTGHSEQAPYFYERSKNYRNIFNNETMFMEARNVDGSWNDNPNTWTEADKWVYTFNVQHDFAGLRDLFKGPEALGKKLDEYYEGNHNDQTNEPSHATVFAYLYADEPAKAQSMIHSLLKNNYWNTPIGISGNDDCGQMSAWYILNAMGFYPVNPASGEYVIGSPLFDEVRVQFPQADHTLTITSKGATTTPYVENLYVDGVARDMLVLKHADLLLAKSIEFVMNAEPQTWGANKL